MSAGDVILGVDEKPLKTWEDPQHSVEEKKVGERLELLIGRDQEQGKMNVVLEEASA
jgi:S1-C subfamily serine protease